MRVKPTLAAAVLGAQIVLAAPQAHAQQPSLADRETARGLMDEGDRKRDGGDLKGALKTYEAADAIMKVPTTGIEVARAQVALGQLLEARETLARVMRLPAKTNEPPAFASARKAADALNGDLATRIPSIQIVLQNLDPGQAVQVTVDGEAVAQAALAVPRRVNPGVHPVLVRTSSFEKKQEVSVAERDMKTVTIDLKEKPPEPPPKPPEPPPSESAAPKVLTYGGFGLAAVGIGVGAVTGVLSLAKTGDLKERCPNNACPAGTQEDIDSAKGLGNISTIAFIAGGVGVGVGVLGLLLSGSEKKEPPPPGTSALRPFEPLRVRAVLGPAYAGVAGVF